MAACSRTGCGIGVHFSEIFPRKTHGFPGFCSFSQENQSKSKLFQILNLNSKESPINKTKISSLSSSMVGLSRGMRWWEKSMKENMLEIESADHLVESLLGFGDRLVVLDFYSPGCGGCKSLHPKICEIAESKPNVMFLKVNQEELKRMCYGLNVHVLPFFRFYRGIEGKVCSFSCTIATINKFKKALDKYGTERCSLGAAKGLDEKEVMALESIGELSKKKLMSVKDLTLEDFLLSSSSSSSANILSKQIEEQHQII